MHKLINRIKSAWEVLTGQAEVMSKEVLDLITEIYEKVEPNNMDTDTKTKLDKVKLYLESLPDKFRKLNDRIAEHESNDSSDAEKLASLQKEVDDMKADHDEVTSNVDAIVNAVEVADSADGDEAPVEPEPSGTPTEPTEPNPEPQPIEPVPSEPVGGGV